MDSRVSQLLHTLGGVYRDPSRVDRDASSLLRSSAGVHLKPNIGELVQNNGDDTTVLVMQGTIPMVYRKSTYQILMDIYLPPAYPIRPPVAFVRLAPNMYLKENHAHVGRDGQVYLPYLHEWRAHSHNLVELVVFMSSVFSTDPPVFTKSSNAATSSSSSSRRPATPPPPYVSVAANTATSNSSVQEQAEAILAAEAADANMAAEAARVAAAQEEELAKQRSAQEAWDARKLQDTKLKLTRKIQTYLKQQQLEIKSTMQSDWQDLQALKHGKQRLEETTTELTETKKRLEQEIQTVDQAIVDISAWLEEASKQTRNENEVSNSSVDDLVMPTNAIHVQMLKLSAENAGLTDALYFLDKALVKGTVTCSAHQKHVRQLAKRQFLARAHLVKISQVLKEESYKTF